MLKFGAFFCCEFYLLQVKADIHPSSSSPCFRGIGCKPRNGKTGLFPHSVLWQTELFAIVTGPSSLSEESCKGLFLQALTSNY